MLFDTKYLNWYENTASKLSGKGLWLRGYEINTLPISEFEKRTFRVLFTRLSTYRDTSDSFTHKLLYQIAKNIENVFPDLAYLPPASDSKLFDSNEIPWMLPTKTKIHPIHFDLIGFSNSIVQEIINIPVMLQKSGIPLLKSERMQSESLPLIIMGGANAVNSSALCTDDPLVDGIFIGEDTECIKQIIELCRNGKTNSIKKKEILASLETVDGFFQPDKIRTYTKKIIKKNQFYAKQLKDAPVLYSDKASSGLLRISEGCPYFCSFCSESWNRKPYTEVTAEALTHDALELKAHSGLSNADLYSFNFNIHSELYKILWNLSEVFTNTGVKSQRFDHIAKHPEILRVLQVIGKSSITCGLEGISGRLRKYLHKNLDDLALFKSLDYLVKSTIRELKIFLIATGKETEEDFTDFSQLMNNLHASQNGLKHKPRIIFSTTPLVRFPLTPLEFEDAPDIENIKNILEKIESLIKKNGFESRSATDYNEYYISQILTRANSPEIINALINSVQKTYFTYYSNISDRFIKEFNEQIISFEINPTALLKGHEITQRHEKIWHFFDTGISEKYLTETYKTCINFNEKNACFGSYKCNGCDACPDNTNIKNITHAVQHKPYTVEELHRKIIARKNNSKTIHFLFEKGIAALGVPSEMSGIAIARALMLADRSLTPLYLGFKSSFWDTENTGTTINGDDIISLQWELSAEIKLVQNFSDKTFIDRTNAYLTKEWGKLKKMCTEIPQNNTLIIVGKISQSMQEYLIQNHLKYTQRKNQEGGFSFDFTKDSIKKDIIRSIETTSEKIILSTGKKFNLDIFIKKCIQQQNIFKMPVYSIMD